MQDGWWLGWKVDPYFAHGADGNDCGPSIGSSGATDMTASVSDCSIDRSIPRSLDNMPTSHSALRKRWPEIFNIPPPMANLPYAVNSPSTRDYRAQSSYSMRGLFTICHSLLNKKSDERLACRTSHAFARRGDLLPTCRAIPSRDNTLNPR